MNKNSSTLINMTFNAQEEIERITRKLSNDIYGVLKKKGAVVGISGGVDSSVVLALCVKAVGADKVLAVLMPEKESEAESLFLAKDLASFYHVNYIIEDITAALEGLGCYKRRDEAIRKLFPEYGQDCKLKIRISSNTLSRHDMLNYFQAVIILPSGEEKSTRLPLKEYLQVVAASNFKQRARMCMLYFHAESRNYAVIGTGNKNEHYQGFFVKYGDGGVDIKPIIHLFKTQVYQLANYLNIPESIRERIPTTDTYSAKQTQEEFFFGSPFEMLDYIWANWEKGITPESISEDLNLSIQLVQNIIGDINRKMHTSEYLRKGPIHL